MSFVGRGGELIATGTRVEAQCTAHALVAASSRESSFGVARLGQVRRGIKNVQAGQLSALLGLGLLRRRERTR